MPQGVEMVGSDDRPLAAPGPLDSTGRSFAVNWLYPQ